MFGLSNPIDVHHPIDYLISKTGEGLQEPWVETKARQGIDQYLASNETMAALRSCKDHQQSHVQLYVEFGKHMGRLHELRRELLALQDRCIELLQMQIDLSKETKDREMPVR
jgi:hypothetical protein